MSRKRQYAMVDVENALKGIPIDGLATLFYKNWFEDRLTVTCPEPDDTIEFTGGHGPTKKDMERLNTLETLAYKVTCVNGRVRLRFQDNEELIHPKAKDYVPPITSPFSLQTARDLFKDRGDVSPDQVDTLSDFIFRVFTRVLVEVKPKVDVNRDTVVIRFLIPWILMTNQTFRELFLTKDCTNDISTFFILAKKDTLELVVEFLFQ